MTAEFDWSACVRAARLRLEGRVTRTPLLSSATLSARLGAPVLLKAENLQRTGSFKFRAALNGVLAHEAECRARGVVASSSGNFAAAAALAAAEIGQRATIVMMPDSSPYKVARTEQFGGRVRFSEPRYEARQELVDAIRRETGALELHPHSSVETIAGNACLALEILADCPDLATLVAPASGGGLVAGLAVGLRLSGSPAKVLAIQPEGNLAYVESLRQGALWTNPRVQTLADGIQASRPGALAFEVGRAQGVQAQSVPEASMPRALRHLAFEEKLVVEPSGALAVAALLEDRLPKSPGPTVLVLSGGNVAPEALARFLGEG